MHTVTPDDLVKWGAHFAEYPPDVVLNGHGVAGLFGSKGVKPKLIHRLVPFLRPKVKVVDPRQKVLAMMEGSRA